MPGWTELREDLRRISRETPDALVSCPDPRDDRPREGRFAIGLAAWATDLAATLHEKYGATVQLAVGAMPFPDQDFFAGRLLELPETPAESLGLTVEPVSPLSVRTGRSTTARVRVVNRSSAQQVLGTNRHLQSAVVDEVGAVVGRFTGPQLLPFQAYPVPPGGSTEVPVLIGTDSLAPRLGYAVPPGQWHLVVLMNVDRVEAFSAPLPLAVTP